jgi:hypothetical protein
VTKLLETQLLKLDITIDCEGCFYIDVNSLKESKLDESMK